ncbi:MAG: CoB--CoM heterodisulfide reductase iron-sulfur subunit A family protein, partial [Deltaproteobacteria bacterium]|nr:CoB--CoM heterodisulfide reductase iron-sulfur subunit A family protein [Deltaproteobacteria bacterium]
EEYGVRYVRGRVARVFPKGKKMIVKGVDTLLGTQVEVEADLVVLATAVTAAAGASHLAEKLRISYDQHAFYVESHPKLRPVETNTSGVFLAGCCQGPKDIPASVGQGSAAAAKVLSLFSRDMLESDPAVANVNINTCVGCRKCINTCPYGAIEEEALRDGRIVAKVLETVCAGCGVCTATCPCGAVQLQHFTDNQLLAEVNALCLS